MSPAPNQAPIPDQGSAPIPRGAWVAAQPMSRTLRNRGQGDLANLGVAIGHLDQDDDARPNQWLGDTDEFPAVRAPSANDAGRASRKDRRDPDRNSATGRHDTPPWEQEGDDLDDDYQTGRQAAAQNAPQGPRFRDRVGNTFMPMRHHAGALGAAAFGEAGTRRQRYLEARRDEREAARRETLGAGLAQFAVARWQGFSSRREALAAGLRDIRQRWAAHRIENALNREHSRGNVHINWDALSGARGTEARDKAPQRRDSDEPAVTSLRDVPRDPRSPLRPADERAAGRDDRRRGRDAAARRSDEPRRDDRHQDGDPQAQPERRTVYNDPAMAIAAREYQSLTPAEQEAIQAREGVRQYVANRAAQLPNLVWGRLAITRMGQLMSGVPETQYDTAAWDELLAKPYLLPAGTRPESWVLHRSIALANQPRTADEARAENEHVDRTRIALRAERRIREAEERAEEERRAEVARRTKPIAEVLHTQLRRDRIEFDPSINGGRVQRATKMAQDALTQVLADRKRRGLPNPFEGSDASQNASNILHAVNAITYAIVERGLSTRKANPNPAQSQINTEALFRAIDLEVLS